VLNASIDIETTGLYAGTHEIIQLAIVPYDKDYNPISRFVSYICPYRPEYADPEAMKTNGLNLEELKTQPTPSQVKTCFIEWKEGSFGSERITPLGHNYGQFDCQFLKLFFTPKMYDKIFGHRIRDTMVAANFLKDVGLQLPESSGLTGLLEFFKVERTTAHDAYEDALSVIKLYKRMREVYCGGNFKV
jgi:DNA polymerase III epsilon subunit-like protein